MDRRNELRDIRRQISLLDEIGTPIEQILRIFRMSKGTKKVAKVMREFAAGKLHSGSKKGLEVTNRKQAVAIAMSESRRGNKRG